MATKITLVGLGQIGTSVGLALKEFGKDFECTGFDIEADQAKQAKKLGAVDHIAMTLPLAVRKADVVMLALPSDQVRETLEIISGHLRGNAIILDTSPVRGEATQWAAEFIPDNCHYTGFTPLIGPRFLQGAERKPDPNLFAEGLIAITIPGGAEPVGLQAAAGLAELLKATPLFADILEVDSYMAALHILPQLMAGALTATTTTQPGWQDGTKFAGRVYALASNPIGSQDAPAGLAASAVMDKENSLRVLDGIIAQLQDFRGLIEQGEVERLEEILSEARKGREKWWEVRSGTKWSHEGMPEIDRELTKLKPFGRWLPERKIPERQDEDQKSPGE